MDIKKGMNEFQINSSNLITEEEILLEEMTEILNLVVIEIDIAIIFQIMKTFKEKFRAEIIIMHQN